MESASHCEASASVVGGFAPLLPDGDYIATVINTEVFVMFVKAWKLVLTFKIGDGPHMGTKLQRYYNVKPGGRGKNGFKVGRHSQYLRDYVTLFGLPSRADRMSLSVWKQHVFTITTSTVKSDSAGQKLPPALHYSKVSEVKLR